MNLGTEQKLWNKNFLNVCISSFFIFINFYLLTATMPIYVKNDLKGSATEVSLIISLYILGTVLLRPFSGKWADQFGKRKMSLIFLTLFIICNLAYFGTKAIVPLLLIRFINGFGFAVSTTSCSALAMDWIPNKRKGEGIGYFSLFMSLAMVIGPALGLFLANNFPYEYVLTAASIFAIASIIFSFFTADKVSEKNAQQNPIRYHGIFKYVEKKSLPASFTSFLLAFSYSSLISYIGLYCIEINLPQTAMFFFIVLASLIIIPRPLIGKLLDQKGPSFLVYPGLILMIIGMLILTQAHHSYLVLLAAAIIGLGYGGVFPSYQTISISSAPSNRAGTASATFFLLYDIGIGGGAFAFGIIAATIGYSHMYFAAAFIAMLSILSYFILVEKRK